MMEAAREAAIKRTLRISDVSPQRLLTARESAMYLSLSEREVYNMISERKLMGVRYGKRLMIDILHLEEWILSHKIDVMTTNRLIKPAPRVKRQ
jgi:excisionase family DNA binding protein